MVEVGDPFEHARALDGSAAAHVALGEPHHARVLWKEALARYTPLAVPEADHVAARLRDLGGSPARAPVQAAERTAPDQSA